MSNLRIMNFEDGLSFIVQTVLSKAQYKPVIVFIDGFPNAGKTKLIRRSLEELYNRGKFGCGLMRRDPLNRLPEYENGLDYLLIQETGAYSPEVDIYTEQNFGKKPDLIVHIAKRFSLDYLSDIRKVELERGDYVVIENPDARNKPDPRVAIKLDFE